MKVLTFVLFGILLCLVSAQWNPSFLGAGTLGCAPLGGFTGGVGCGIPVGGFTGGLGCAVPLGGFGVDPFLAGCGPWGFGGVPIVSSNLYANQYTNAAAAQFQSANTVAASQFAAAPLGFGGYGYPIYYKAPSVQASTNEEK